MTRQREEILERLQDVKYVGPSVAEQLYEEISVRSIEDVVEAADKGWLSRLDGIGASRERDILESARSLRKRRPEASGDDADDTGAGDRNGDVSVKTVDRRAAGGEPGAPNSGPARAEVPSTPSSSDEPEPESDSQPGAETDGGRGRPRPRIERFIDRLRCPACGHDTFDRENARLTCTACRREYEVRSGIADLAPPNKSRGGLVQSVMESRLYSRFYENTARPWFTSIVSDRSVEEEMRVSADLLELGPESIVLDVACGTSNFTRFFAEQIGSRTKGYDDQSLVVGMDLSWPMLEKARDYLRRDGLNDRIFLVRGDATRMPIGRASFNRLHCAGALHFMDDIDEALRNFARALQPEGICVIGTFLARGPLVWRLAQRAAELPTDFHWFEREELHERLERAGLSVVEDRISRQAISVKARRK